MSDTDDDQYYGEEEEADGEPVAPSTLRLKEPIYNTISKRGPKPVFATPEELRDTAIEYFKWADRNGMEEEKLFHHQGSLTRGRTTKLRAYTVAGLCLFLDISRKTWGHYHTDRGDEFREVCEWIEEVIRDQKFTGAACNLLNPTIIARDLGLAEKSEVTNPDGSLSPNKFDLSKLNDEEFNTFGALLKKLRGENSAE